MEPLLMHSLYYYPYIQNIWCRCNAKNWSVFHRYGRQADLQLLLGIDNLAPWLLCRQLLHLHTSIWGSCSSSTSEQTTHICKHLRQPEFPQFSVFWCVHSFFLTALTCLSTWPLWARTMTHWTLSIHPYIQFPCFSPFFCESKRESNPKPTVLCMTRCFEISF